METHSHPIIMALCRATVPSASAPSAAVAAVASAFGRVIASPVLLGSSISSATSAATPAARRTATVFHNLTQRAGFRSASAALDREPRPLPDSKASRQLPEVRSVLSSSSFPSSFQYCMVPVLCHPSSPLFISRVFLFFSSDTL